MAKIYVSSTIADLEPERRAVMEWLVKRGHQPVHSYRPDSETVRESCLDDIESCDLYVLILGHRYGFQPEEGNPEKLSITHLEFQRAGQSEIPRIVLLRTSIPDCRLSDLEDPKRAPLVLAFREEVRKKIRAGEFSDPRGLMEALSTGIESKLEKLRIPTGHKRAEVWLAAHLQDISQQFASHMSASALKPGANPEEHYLDLVVTETKLGRREAPGSEDIEIGKQRHPLEDVLQQSQGPLLLIGEGGCGKTTSLLYSAARAADRARADETAPIPIFINLARLTVLNDLPDLLQLIVDQVPLVDDWNEFLTVSGRRPLLYLFDSFNEMPERLQNNATVILNRFIEKQKNHFCLIGSRLIPEIEQLSRPPSQFRTFEILRLTSDQVQDFLQDLGLASLYDRMPKELRGLTGNPFMLLAIARTLAGTPERTLPRNQGKLYERFVRGWMKNEETKRSRSLQFSYERVKEPLLAYLAKRMTSAGLTSLIQTEEIEQEIEIQLAEIYQRIQRLGGMPDDWKVDPCLNEILGDGLLKRVGNQLHFIHQSIQEYFTSVYFFNLFREHPDALAEFTPKLTWELVSTHSPADVPNHRFVPVLLMMTGLLENSTKVVEALAVRNLLLAAATASSASRVDASLVVRMEESWLDLLEHTDLKHRIMGCSCAVLAKSRNPRIIRRLVDIALSSSFDNSYVGSQALGRLNDPDIIITEIVDRACNLSDIDYKGYKRNLGKIIKELQSKQVVRKLFDLWRTSEADSTARRRFEYLMASVDESLLKEELQRIRSGTPPNPEVAADAERALGEASSWVGGGGFPHASRIRKRMVQARKRFDDRLAETVTALKNHDDQQITAGLRSSDPYVFQASASLAAERQLPVEDDIVDLIVKFGVSRLTSPLVLLCGEDMAVAKLVERSLEECYCVGSLPVELVGQLATGKISESVKAELKRLDVREDLRIAGTETEGDTSIWILMPSSWSDFKPLYQLRASADHLGLYDCNVARRVFQALAEIPGEASQKELWKAVDHDDPEIQNLAIRALSEQGDSRLANRLLAKLRSSKSSDFIIAALRGLERLHPPEAVALVNDLLSITEAELWEVHPTWGRCYQSCGWSESIHGVLATLNADSEIQQVLDKALASEDPVRKVAALKEVSRWFAKKDLSPERNATWQAPERVRRLIDLALHDSTPSVRHAAAGTLVDLKSEVPLISLTDALSDNSVEMQVAAGEALVQMQAQEHYERIAEVMLHVAKTGKDQALRQRAGEVLGKISGGVELLYQPIQEQLVQDDAQCALEMIEVSLEILPEDANLFWWRGHALKSLGRLELAADSFQRAFELERQASVIPQALAETFLELGDPSRAMEIARRGVEIEPSNADVQSMLAWSSYKAGEIPKAISAAGKALDLNPVHKDAIWIVLLSHLRQANLDESRSTFQHALLVRKLLSPGLDTSFLATFMKEVQNIKTNNAEISQLMEEIKDAFHSGHEAGPN